jgi:hypothetical protein
VARHEALRGWFRAAAHQLHEQQRETERQRRQLADRREQIRRLAARVESEAA